MAEQNTTELVAQATALVTTGLNLAGYATRAITAANNGDRDAAEAYLAQARDTATSASAGWHDAPGPTDG